MYPILILRCELVCLVILIFLFFTSRAYNIDNESKAFSRILFFAIIHVVFDAITVLTVNNTETVPEWLNWICHVIFYLSAILFSNEIANYVVAICYPNKSKKLYILGLILTAIYVCCLSFLEIYYVEDVGTYSSAGPAAIVGYGLAFSFFIFALVIIFTHMDMMSTSIKSALIPMMLVLMVTEICQIIWRSVLFTGGAVTIVTVGFFFSLENPVEVFKKKAMIDAMTGVRSRRSYEEDIEEYDKKFKLAPSNDFTFVFIDLNDLRMVNNHFGHAEGDNYITLIATALKHCMLNATTIYRIGGDEFLIYYMKTADAVVEKEINNLKDECIIASEGLEYTAAVSAGFATSSNLYKSLKDVVRTADYAMYQNKAKEKLHGSPSGENYGAKLNYSGLTDKTFDVICASSESNYPFITNMDTNVTRIAPAWKEYFGLDEEFYIDFVSVWKDRIHPNFLKGYMDDVIAVINGHRKYHKFSYLARKSDGEYVKVTCQGSVYRDISDGVSYFTGYMTNHGLDENVDSITGLPNFDMLTIDFYKHTDNRLPFSLIKLRLNGFARINMLYGYAEGSHLLKMVGDVLSEELGELGRVFCQDSVNFSVFLETCDKRKLEDYYRKVSDRLAKGIALKAGPVPVIISGGAYTNIVEECDNQRIRSGLMFAVDESQNSHQNRLVFYHDINDASGDDDISLLARIHADALADNTYFRLRYQPIVDVNSGETVATEVLLRWIHPIYGEVVPEKFIAFLENDPCYYHLGLNILEHAIQDMKEFQKTLPELKLSVNITALQLQNESFLDDVFKIMNTYDFAPGKLILELTERCKEMEAKFLTEKIAVFRSKGVLVAFDDLGTGYSTISLLMDIPVDEIKLDKNFVKDIGNRDNYQLFVKALVLGQESSGNSYSICLEGIENEDMLNEVRKFGNFLVQGYYFSKPLLADEFIKYINGK